MRNRMNLLKGFIAGIVFMALLSGTFVMASPVMREVVFGVNLRINGALVEFDADARPFTMDGRTFLPVRTVADLFGAEVGFDPDTNTVLLTADNIAVHTGQPTPLGTTMFEVIAIHDNSFVEARPTVNMLGVAHLDALVYNVRGGFTVNTSRHNLGGQYARLTGVFGHVDGSDRYPAGITIIGDGQQLLREDIGRDSAPLRIDIDVSGVQLLTIEVTGRASFGAQASEVALVSQLNR